MSASAISRAALGRLTTASVAVVAVALLAWIPRSAIPLIDGDVWWHLRAGDEVLSTGRIPSADSWSIAGGGMDWTSQDWLSNVLMAWIYGAGDSGATVLSIVFSLVVVASLAILWLGIGTRRPEAGWLSRLVWLTAGLTVAGPVIGVRVQVIDLPLAAATLVVCWHYIARRQRLVLLWLPVIAVAWANLHAGWVLLFLLGGAVVVGELIDGLLRRDVYPVPLRRAELGWLAAAGVAAFAAIGVNPNGLALYWYPIETASIAAHRDFLAEWSPPELTSLPGLLFAGFVLIGIVPALALGWRRMRSADVLILVGLTVMAATAARFLLIAGPLCAAIVAFTLGPALARSSAGARLAQAFDRMSRRPPSPRVAAVNGILATVLAAAGVGVTVARVSPAAQRAAIGDHMPVAAVDWIVENEPGSRAFNTYSWGGYLGFRRPDSLIFIDGRSDIYGDAPIRAYADAISLRSDPAALLERYDIDHVLFNSRHPFAAWLDVRPEWSRAYSDGQAAVWVRTGPDE